MVLFGVFCRGFYELLKTRGCGFVRISPVLKVTACIAVQINNDMKYGRLILRKSSFSNLSVTSPTSQLIIQPFRRFTYVTAHSPTLPLFHLRHCSFSNPSFASATSQALHLIQLASRPCNDLYSTAAVV